jgi:hypothetical protein
MGAFNLCRRYVNELPRGKIFVTRELLAYGNRDTIDKCTQAMVGSAMIERLARGVFRRNDVGLPEATIEKIAEAKARGFGKYMIPSGVAQAAALGLEKPIKPRKKKTKLPKKILPTATATFAVLGTTSVFWTVHGYVKLKHIAARKYFVAQHKVGEVLAGIWHASEDAYIDFQSILRKANFETEENRRFRELANWVPEWVHEHFRAHHAGANIHAPWRLYPFTKLTFPETLVKGKGHSKVKEVDGVYRVGTKCSVSLYKGRSNQDALDSQDLLVLLTECVDSEYNFKFMQNLFSSS